MGTWTVSRSLIGFWSVSCRIQLWAPPVSYRDGEPCGSVRLATGGCDHTAGISERRQKNVVMCFIESELWFIRGTTMIDITYITCIKDIYIQYHTIEDLEVDIDFFQWWWLADGYRLSDKALLFVDLSPIVVGSTVTVRFYIALRIKTLPK
jgi:hypothetical protein